MCVCVCRSKLSSAHGRDAFLKEPLAPVDQHDGFLTRASSSLCGRYLRIQEVGYSRFLDAPLGTLLRLVNILLPRPPVPYDYSISDQVKDDKRQENKEDVSLRHTEGVALFTCVGLLLHGRWGIEEQQRAQKSTLESCALFLTSIRLPFFWKV